jgi:predicted nucleic acid-binding protein
VILADTNILLRSLHPEHPHHAIAENALSVLRLRRETLCIAPQNLVEFWAVATRPRSENGLGMDSSAAAWEIAKLRRLFHLLAYTPEVPETWQRMVTDLRVSGKQTHDAHLVAVMRVNGVPSILTFNWGHFVRFPGIAVLDPAQV